MPSSDNELLQFPCSFPIKAMGLNQDDFETTVRDMIQRHVKDITQCQFNSRASKDGKYLSITATIEATSKDQLDAIYQDLSAHPKVLMAL